LDAAPGFAPGDRGIALIDRAQFGEQVEQAALFGPGLNRVVGCVEVARQQAVEDLAEDGIHHIRITPTFDPEVGEVFGAEGPEPVGGAVDPPAGFVGVQDASLADGLLKLHPVGRQCLPEPDPGLGEATGADAQPEHRRRSTNSGTWRKSAAL